VEAFENLEDSLYGFQGDADTLVGDTDAPLVVGSIGPDTDDGGAVGGADLEGVADEVLDDLDEQGGVAANGREGSGGDLGGVLEMAMRRFSRALLKASTKGTGCVSGPRVPIRDNWSRSVMRWDIRSAPSTA
jgi:hypothetical protein